MRRCLLSVAVTGLGARCQAGFWLRNEVVCGGGDFGDRGVTVGESLT